MKSTNAGDALHSIDQSTEDSTVDRAHDRLAMAIRQGEYRPGQRLVESELAESLGISRVTLRAVFMRLRQEDYIAVERNKGARVRAFDVRDAMEILQTREILESAAAGLAAERITDAELDELGSILTQMESANDAKQAERYSGLNRQFHQVVLSASRQPTLIKFVTMTPYPLVMRQFRNFGTSHPRQGSLQEHQAIYAALRVRNMAAAEASMKLHVSSARKALTIASAQSTPSGSLDRSTDEAL